jgi:methionine-rich copper-binding protein CopC
MTSPAVVIETKTATSHRIVVSQYPVDDSFEEMIASAEKFEMPKRQPKDPLESILQSKDS